MRHARIGRGADFVWNASGQRTCNHLHRDAISHHSKTIPVQSRSKVVQRWIDVRNRNSGGATVNGITHVPFAPLISDGGVMQTNNMQTDHLNTRRPQSSMECGTATPCSKRSSRSRAKTSQQGRRSGLSIAHRDPELEFLEKMMYKAVQDEARTPAAFAETPDRWKYMKRCQTCESTTKNHMPHVPRKNALDHMSCSHDKGYMKPEIWHPGCHSCRGKRAVPNILPGAMNHHQRVQAQISKPDRFSLIDGIVMRHRRPG